MMKTRILRGNVLGLICLTFMLSVAGSIFATSGEFRKVLSREFPSDASSTVWIENKYGDIHLKEGTRDMVSFEVVITVEHQDKEKADKLLEYIDVYFSKTGNDIKAVTSIEDHFNASPALWLGSGQGKKFRIDYTVEMPKSLQVKLLNRYGNIFINEHDGQVDIDLKYGNMNIHNLTRGDTKPLNQISMAYSKANIDRINWLKADIKYSTLEIEKGRAIMLVSRYSKIGNIEASSIICDSRYDTYKLGNLVNMVSESQYSNFVVEKLSGKLDVEHKYTELNIGLVPAGFDQITIDNNYGKVNIGIASNASYEIDAKADYARIIAPDGGNTSRESGNNSSSVKGLIGNPVAKIPLVRIQTRYGNVKLE